jgi:hypothetical protein
MANYYRYNNKGGSSEYFGSVSSTSYAATDLGTLLSQSYPLTSSISVHFFPDETNTSSSQYSLKDTQRKKIKSLKNVLNKYVLMSPFYQYSSSNVSYEDDDITIVNIPSIFYGDTIKKGTVELSTYVDGVLLSKIKDTGYNGELVRVSGSQTLTKNREVAGVVLYDEGIVLLFDKTPLTTVFTESFYSANGNTADGDYPRWSNWGISANTNEDAVVKTSYDIEFDGINKIPQLVMLAHAPKGQYNHSNNSTYILYASSSLPVKTGSFFYQEDQFIPIKNIAKGIYTSPSASFQKETYINKIYIYDENKNIIAVAKTSKPIRKTEDRDFTFKLKLDL